MEFFLLLVIAVLGAVVYFMQKQNKKLKNKKEESQKPDISSDIINFKNIGELSVFKINSKEIVTCENDVMSGIWKNLFGKLMTKKQISIIFDFEVNFVYDLRDNEMSIEQGLDNSYKVNMPKCKYKYSIKDMKIYDEKNAKLMPYLLPDSVNSLFGGGFSAEEKNQLITTAKEELKKISLKMDEKLQEKIHKSACDTMQSLAKSFGVEKIELAFNDNLLNYTQDEKLENGAKISIKTISINEDNEL